MKLILVLIILLLSGIYLYLFSINIPNMTQYTFIHPTKSGGTAVERYFKQHYSSTICGSGHGNICKNNNNPIIIIRDVKTRFYSMYKYWKNGAVDTKYKRNKEWGCKYTDTTVLDFINMLKKMIDNYIMDSHGNNILNLL